MEPEDQSTEVDDELLLAWLDGLLSPAEHERILRCLAGSKAARDLLFELARGPSLGFARSVALPGIAAPEDALDFRLEGPFGGIRALMDAPLDGLSDEAPVYTPDGKVDFILRPGRPLSEDPVAEAYVARGGGPLVHVERPIEIAPGGTMRLRVPARALFAAPGRHTLCVALGAGSPERFVGRSLAEARALDLDVRWLTADAFYDPEPVP